VLKAMVCVDLTPMRHSVVMAQDFEVTFFDIMNN